MNEKITEPLSPKINNENNLRNNKINANFENQETKDFEVHNNDEYNKKLQNTSPYESKTIGRISPYVERKKQKIEAVSGVQIKLGHNGNLFQKKKNGNKKRLDRNGIEINSKNKKKVKLTFIDNISSQPLVEIIDVENFKEFNFVSMPSLEDLYVKNTSCCSCIFF